MSFGFGIGDFITISTLAWRTYKSCKDSSDNFNSISSEVASLHIVLKEVEESLSGQTLSGSQETQLRTLGNGCNDVLNDLNMLVEKYNSFGTNSQRTWDRVKWGREDIQSIRERLISNITMLNTFNAILTKRQRNLAAFTERPGATVLEQHQHFIISWLENAVRTGALEGLADDEEAKIYVTLDNGDEGESLTPELDSERTSDTRTSTRSGSDTRSTASRTLQAQQPLDSSTNKRSEVRIPRHTRFLHRMNRVLAITPKGFFDAVMQGNLERVEELLTDPGLDINCRGDCRITALHLAAYEGYRDLAKIILDKGAKTEAKDERGQTALHFAARRDHLDLVEILLANGADIEASTDDGETALYTAAWYGHSEVVEFLLTRGANIRTRDHNGWTPLHRAAYGGHAMVIEILLNRGAVIEARIIDGVTALLFAAPRGNLKAVEMLLRQEANANAKTNTGYTSLHQASLRGDTNMVKLLLSSKKVKVDANTNSGKTALFVAASNNHLIDAKSVQHAISHGNVDILTLLLNRGTDRNISNDNRSTPLDETMNGK